MADDKVRELAEKLAFHRFENVERRIRAELKPLLDAVGRVLDGLLPKDFDALAAELKRWRK